MDDTVEYRAQRQAELNVAAEQREKLEAQYGDVWNTTELSEHFDVVGFLAPFIVVIRKSDGQKGSLEFQHSPRLYFNWSPDRG